jgi:hypothetical protein
MTRHSPGFAPYRFVFERKSREPLPSSGRQFDLRGKCLVCECRPDPLTPGMCACTDLPLLRARAYTCVRTREERGTK